MKKTALLAATALIASSVVTVSTPAFANPPNNQIDTSGLTPDEFCEVILRPHDNSGHETAAINEVEDQPIGDPTIERATNWYQQLPTGDPSYADFSNFHAPFRNGGSPNIWALADAGTTSYPSSDLYYAQEEVQPMGTTFDCEVWKDPGGPGKGPNAVFPPGLQSTGHATITGELRTPTDDYIDPNGGPVQTGGTPDVAILICISPNNTTKGKPGTWTGKHGYTSGQCESLDKSELGAVPSGNAPN